MHVQGLFTIFYKAACGEGLHERLVRLPPFMLARLKRVLVQAMGKRKDQSNRRFGNPRRVDPLHVREDDGAFHQALATIPIPHTPADRV